MAHKVAINGFGRIGKQFFLACLEKNLKWNFVINHPDSLDHMVYALKYDSVHPPAGEPVSHDGKNLIVGKRKIPVFHELDPEKLPWGSLKIDLVVECTGHFRKREGASKHLKAGAKKVLISAPSEDCDRSIVKGINDEDLKKSDRIISAASCTTNCLTPMVKVLHDSFTVLNALFVTAHAYTSTQGVIDRDDKKDMRRGRAAAANIVPTTSGAATATEKAFPKLKGKIDGYALRVPIADGSVTNLYTTVKSRPSCDEVNKTFNKASKGKLKGILQYNEDPIVSSDIIHNPHSCIYDSQLSRVSGNLISISGWYDNEWGYSNRLAEVAALALKK